MSGENNIKSELRLSHIQRLDICLISSMKTLTKVKFKIKEIGWVNLNRIVLEHISRSQDIFRSVQGG